ncbi:MAG: hypothetical protein COZ76_02755 [Flavobacteriales bacterium CG_4_8_14_3_um_filter_35_10]|nr:MAG: hypothetical protein COZ76_02755 [Flavobacteriales bacterium CG_4_8_14_3_um_filter_35_10]
MALFKELRFIFKNVVKNQKRHLKSVLGNHLAFAGATHKSRTVSESITYINNVFEDYLKYGNLSKESIFDKTILEIGPGDNFGVALKFLALGAKKVYLLDKFYSERDDIQQLTIYNNLRVSLNAADQKRFDDAISLINSSLKINPDKLEYIYGFGIEEGQKVFKNNPVDLIVSRAVMQEISNTKKAFKVMNAILKNGGMMLHKIDLRDYGMFTKANNHQLGNLMYPSWIYKLMTNHSGLPNRNRISHYKILLESLHFKSTFYITHIFGSNENEFIPHKNNIVYRQDYDDNHLNYIEQVRSKLANEFKKLPALDLLISGVFVVATKK